LQREADAVLEIAALAPLGEELERVLDVVRRREPAIRLGGEVLDDLRRTGFFLIRIERTAGTS
jgi:hypothetical protein